MRKNNSNVISIFSDVSFEGYQHVNQMYYRYSLSQGDNVLFFERFYMNLPRWLVIKRVFERIFRAFVTKARKRPTHNVRSACLDFPVGRKVYNLPPTNTPLDKLNGFLVKKQLPSFAGIALTFVPSRALSNVFDNYEKLAYYCVHDSSKQSYPMFNTFYEKELVIKSNVVFCDNMDVIVNLGATRIIDLSIEDDKSLVSLVSKGEKFFYVPSPVPNEFFSSLDGIESKFDFCYFGSLHDDIDKQYILDLLCLGYSILIISNERLSFEHESLYYQDAIYDMSKLVLVIGSAKRLLLPYKNSEFMNTISPAKLFQCLALNKPIYCSNSKLSNKFDFIEELPSDGVEDRLPKSRHLAEHMRVDILLSKVRLVLSNC